MYLNLIVYENISIVYRAQNILYFTRPDAGETSNETKMSSTRMINKIQEKSDFPTYCLISPDVIFFIGKRK